MANRIFRLAISPEDVTDVRRVIDFDGRASLDEVHQEIAHEYRLDASEHLYAFFLSGRFWDAASAYWDPRTEGQHADKALLFRLKLVEGQSIAYLLDFGTERRFVVSVVSVDEAAQPLAEPVLVESVGDASAVAAPFDDEVSEDPPEIADLVPLAEAFLDIEDALDEFEDELATARLQAHPWEAHDEDDLPLTSESSAAGEGLDLSHTRPTFVAAAAAALALLQVVAGDVQRLLRLDEWLIQRSLGTRLLDLPMGLVLVGEHDEALRLARALLFVDRELLEGNIAIILARAGDKDQALRQVDENLKQAQDVALVELKAGDVYRALGDLPAAEAYYRRSLSEAKTSADRYDARLRLVGCLIDAGRDAEANQLLQEARGPVAEVAGEAAPDVVGAALPAVGRNEPCPCGSGKKYKKCHGAGA